MYFSADQRKLMERRIFFHILAPKIDNKEIAMYFQRLQRLQRQRYPLKSVTRIILAAISIVVLLYMTFLTFFMSLPDINRQPPTPPFHQISSPSDDLWHSKLSKFYYGCCNASKRFAAAHAITSPNIYLMIETSKGLSEQMTEITDAVVVARILNATLVIPKLDQRSSWKDSSDFAEIFDVEWFISFLLRDVKIIKQLPRKELKSIKGPYTMYVHTQGSLEYYQLMVLPVLLKKHVVQLIKFDNRLSNMLETDLQKLRCRVNYYALRFIDPIKNIGNILVRRMRAKSKHFIALHLRCRFDLDTLAFSNCYYGGGDKEKREFEVIRRRWKTLSKTNIKKFSGQRECSLTPEEVGLMLRALGFDKDVHLYVAFGELYGGEGILTPLKRLFPNFHSKETLAKEELASFSPLSSSMAAIDFIVYDDSDVFVTNFNDHMTKILAGRRRFFNHKRTIRPNVKKLHSLFLNRSTMTWETFATKVLKYQRGFMGEPDELILDRGKFYENPLSCICKDAKAKLRALPVFANVVTRNWKMSENQTRILKHAI